MLRSSNSHSVVPVHCGGDAFREQELDRARDDLRMLPVVGSVPGTQEGQQRQPEQLGGFGLVPAATAQGLIDHGAFHRLQGALVQVVGGGTNVDLSADFVEAWVRSA